MWEVERVHFCRCLYVSDLFSGCEVCVCICVVISVSGHYVYYFVYVCEYNDSLYVFVGMHGDGSNLPYSSLVMDHVFADVYVWGMCALLFPHLVLCVS